MSGFSPDWLALREQADHRSRAPQLSFKIAARLAGLVNARIVDLGCGTGSNLRALAPILSNDQYWRLVDYSEELLAHARILLREWADYAETTPEGMTLYYDEKIIHVSFVAFDLKHGITTLLEPRPDLVTSSAFFDLISEDWIKAMAAEISRQKILFHTVLSYDGRIQWFPPHALDSAVQTAFNAHQTSDKGFGPASGPNSTNVLMEAFQSHGYLCEAADSPWIITRNDEAALLQSLGTGIGEAASSSITPLATEAWFGALAQRRSVLIGHRDLYAAPPMPPEEL